MAYFPGHKYFLRSAASTSTITEATGIVATPTAIGTASDIGYTSPGDVNSDEGTQIGYAAGRRSGSYAARGARTHTLTADLRLGSVDYIKDFCTQTDESLPYVDLFFGVSGEWAQALRRARCSRLSLAFQEGGAQELTASAVFEAIARESVSPITLGYDFEEFGPALLWTDVRSFNIGATSLRQSVMGLSVDLDHQLERKGVRPDFGDNIAGSRTSYDLLPHHAVITGSLQLHDLPTYEAGLFTGSTSAMEWSSIVVEVNDIGNKQIYDLTIINPRPTGRQQNSVESAAQMNWTVPFVADDIEIAITR